MTVIEFADKFRSCDWLPCKLVAGGKTSTDAFDDHDDIDIADSIVDNESDLWHLHVIVNFIMKNYRGNIILETGIIEDILLENPEMEFAELMKDKYFAFSLYKLLHRVESTCENDTIVLDLGKIESVRV